MPHTECQISSVIIFFSCSFVLFLALQKFIRVGDSRGEGDRLTCHVTCTTRDSRQILQVTCRVLSAACHKSLSAAHKYPGAWMGSQLERFGHFSSFLCLFYCLFTSPGSQRPPTGLASRRIAEMEFCQRETFHNKRNYKKEQQVIAREKSHSR